MKKKRYLPLGYEIVNGETKISLQEAAIVKMIFDSYLGGSSLQQLANIAQQSNITFNGNTVIWNKNTIARILDDQRYWNDSRFPAILEKNTGEVAVTLRKEKATPYRENIFFQKLVRCGHCDSKLIRNSKSKPHIFWECDNCGIRYGAIRDVELLKVVTERFVELARNPSTAQIEPEHNNKISLREIQLTNQINQALDRRVTVAEEIVSLILECAMEKYHGCSLGTSDYQTLRIRELLKACSPIEEMNQDLFHQIVLHVILKTDGAVQLRLCNQKII